MTTAVRIPPELYAALPAEYSTSSLIRELLAGAVADPLAVVSAFAARLHFDVPPTSEPKRYAIYLPKEEYASASALASRFLLSFNQLVQVLLEDMLFRAGRWPETTETTTETAGIPSSRRKLDNSANRD